MMVYQERNAALETFCFREISKPLRNQKRVTLNCGPIIINIVHFLIYYTHIYLFFTYNIRVQKSAVFNTCNFKTHFGITVNNDRITTINNDQQSCCTLPLTSYKMVTNGLIYQFS